jgi:hypothetical protein
MIKTFLQREYSTITCSAILYFLININLPPQNRNSKTFSKEDALKVVDQWSDGHKVSIDNPDFCVYVELGPLFCGVSLLKNWNKFKKYNVQSLLHPEQAAKHHSRSTDHKKEEGKKEEKKEEKKAEEVEKKEEVEKAEEKKEEKMEVEKKEEEKAEEKAEEKVEEKKEEEKKEEAKAEEKKEE